MRHKTRDIVLVRQNEPPRFARTAQIGAVQIYNRVVIWCQREYAQIVTHYEGLGSVTAFHISRVGNLFCRASRGDIGLRMEGLIESCSAGI